MAAYTGILVTGPHGSEDGWTPTVSATIAAAPGNLPCPIPPPSLDSIIGIAESSLNNTYAKESVYGYVGEKVDSFIDDYYYRFHVVASAFNYSAILYEITEEFLLWNAFFVSADCSEIIEVEGDEFELAGLEAPYTLNNLQYTMYSFTIPIEGTASFASSITFDFGLMGEPIVIILGARPIILPGRFTFPVTERLVFNTEILSPHNRTEQRKAKRLGIPEDHYSTRILVRNDTEVAQFETVLHVGMKRQWPVPLWPQAARHIGILPAGSGTIAVDTRYADFHAGGLILIWESTENSEFVLIDSVGDNLITLDAVTLKNYWQDKWIIPCCLGRCLQASRIKRYHGSALCDMTWRIEDVEAVTGFVAAMTYDGYAVLTDPAILVGDSGQASHDPDIAVLDAGTGPFETVSNSDFNLVDQSHGWRPWTKAACWWLRQFLYNIKGRQKSFLVPTFRRDIELSRDFSHTDTSLYVRNCGFAQNMGLNDMRTYLAFRPPGSDIIVRKITGSDSVNDTEEMITINTSPGEDFKQGSYLCWVDKVRLASDEIEMRWYGRGKLSAETPLVRVTE